MQLENTLQKYKDCIENKWTKPIQQDRFYRRLIRKTKNPYYHEDEKNDDKYAYNSNFDDYDDDDGDDDQEIRYVKPKKSKNKKRIVYIDEIDGNDEDEDEGENVEEPESHQKRVVKKPPAKKMKKDTKRPKLGIMKSI